MYKRSTILISLLFSFFWTKAQSLSPTVIASAGGSDKSNNIRLDWTLGEPATETVTTKQAMYTQGFHQPYLQVINIPVEVDSSLGYEVMVYPNPVSSTLHVYLKGIQDSKVYLRLSDINGRTVYLNSVYSAGSSTTIDMSQLAADVYILFISTPSGQTLKSYKIIKTH
jgi:hypothetical protein